jgi:serine phosphatase RsbU (regulator of sigma subunit)
MVITRNNSAPAIIAYNDEIHTLEEPSQPVGLYRDTRPVITQLPLEPGLISVVYTDGLVHAGSRTGEHIDVPACLQTLIGDSSPSPQPDYIADELLAHALKLDRGRPVDDITVVVVGVLQRSGDDVRRLTVRLPLGP